MPLARRLLTLAVAALTALGITALIGSPAGAEGSTASYHEQVVLVLDRPAMPRGGTNTATIRGCRPGFEVPFVLRSWTQPGPGNSLGEGTVTLGSVVVGADGTASLTFTLPEWLTPDHYAVKAMCETSGGGYSGWLMTKVRVTGAVGPRSRSAVGGSEDAASVLAASASRDIGGDPGSPAAAAEPAGGSAEAGGSPLARTGIDLADVERVGVILLALGGAAVLVTRKRRLSVDL